MKPTDLKLNLNQFPYTSTLSFLPLIRYWQTKINDDNKGMSRFAREINRQLEKAPGLLQSFRDCCDLAPHEDLVELLMTAVFPPAAWDREISGALIPFQNISFYHTPKFREIFITDKNELKRPLNMDARAMLILMLRQAMFIILDKIYQIPVPQEESTVFTVPDYRLGLYRHYNVTFDTSFLEVKALGNPPPVTEAEFKLLLSHLQDLDLWLKYLPPSHYAFEGFYVIQLVDVTEQETLSSIKQDLLEKEVFVAADRFEQLQEKIRIYFNRPHLQLGVAAFNKKKNTFVNFGRKLNYSFLIPQNEGGSRSLTFTALYDRLMLGQDPWVIEDMALASLSEEVIGDIRKMGFHSIILALLRSGDEILGIIELGSPYAGDLNHFSLAKVEQVLPHFAAAVKRHAEDLESRVQKVITEKFTAIHPTVAWRFKEAALQLLDRQESGLPAEIEPIIFHEVYPLYGVSDIRSSATERNKAIQGDLVEHLQLIEQVLRQALRLHPLPILEELKFSISRNLRQLKRGLLSEDEAAIFEMIKKHVEPVFQYLGTHVPALQAQLETYRRALDPDLGILYKRRKSFEESLTLINQTVSDYLDQEEQKAQAMYPHFFEKFKTDGVEFTIYVGGSLVENKPFNLVFLKNLRLWQLMTMCEITRRTAALKSRLSQPLETTQLILIHSQPLSITFRRDERKFDVASAYNIRYEIIKKRIDKATVVGTKERLTQPGTIALVYSQGREANEYLEYIEYLQNIGQLTKEVEDLDVEELQGVRGLKALRVRVQL
jgi:hypothetical protein